MVQLFVHLKCMVAKEDASRTPSVLHETNYCLCWCVDDDLRSLTAWGNILPSALVVRQQPHLNIATVTHASRPVKVNLLYYPCWHCVGTGATVNFPWKSLWKFASLGPSKISKPGRNKSSSAAAVWTKAWKRCTIRCQQDNPISEESNDSGTKERDTPLSEEIC